MKKKLNQNFSNLLASDKLDFDEQQQIFYNISIRLDEAIKDANYYGNVIQRMQSCNEGDVVTITISSPGGNVDGMVAILTAMQTTLADVTVLIEGEAASAASIIALNAPSLAVGQYASMMCHNASSVLMGKAHEIASNWEFTKTYLEDIIIKTYKHFLTDSEIESLIQGKDFYFNADQILERLERKNQIIEREHKKQVKDEAKKSKPIKEKVVASKED